MLLVRQNKAAPAQSCQKGVISSAELMPSVEWRRTIRRHAPALRNFLKETRSLLVQLLIERMTAEFETVGKEQSVPRSMASTTVTVQVGVSVILKLSVFEVRT